MADVSIKTPGAPSSFWRSRVDAWKSKSSPQLRWALLFVAACVGAVTAVVFAIWALSGFVNLRSIGLSGNALAGLIIGILVSSALGAGLMALVFESDLGGQDESVYRASAPPPDGGTHTPKDARSFPAAAPAKELGAGPASP